MENINDIDFNLYKTFLMVAKTGSVSKAAELLYVSQPAVSRNLKQLEESLNCKLFNRTSKGVELTADAVNLLFYVESAYNMMITGYKKLNDSTDLLVGDIRIGFPTHVGTFLVSKFIEIFNERYPGIKFHIVNKSTGEMINMLEKRMLDIIVDNYPISSAREDVEIIELMKVDNCLVGNEKYKNIASGDKININDLFKYPLLLPSKGTSTRKDLENIINCELEPVIEVPTTEVMLDLVKKGLGIGYFAKPSVKGAVNNGELYSIPVGFELPKNKICVAYMEEFLTSAPKKFVDLLKEGTQEIIQREAKALRVILTKKCIYNCEFCHKEGLNRESENLINADNIAYIYELANKTLGIKKVNLTGGEPLLRDDIIDILSRLRNLGAMVDITTNGYYLDKFEDIGKYANKISISLHTMDRENYEKLNKISNSFDKVITNIKKLRSKYPTLNISLNMTLNKDINSSNADIKSMIEFSKTLKTELKIVEMYPTTSANFVSIERLIPLLESMGYEIKKKEFRKTTYSNGKHIIVLVKCTCSAVKSHKSGRDKLCKMYNDIYITPDLKISICREKSSELDLYNDYIMKNEVNIIGKLEEACDKMGEKC